MAAAGAAALVVGVALLRVAWEVNGVGRPAAVGAAILLMAFAMNAGREAWRG
jgi:hypothetical protein